MGAFVVLGTAVVTGDDVEVGLPVVLGRLLGVVVVGLADGPAVGSWGRSVGAYDVGLSVGDLDCGRIVGARTGERVGVRDGLGVGRCVGVRVVGGVGPSVVGGEGDCVKLSSYRENAPAYAPHVCAASAGHG